jgi:hypothetical protein
MDATTATDFVTANKGAIVSITFVEGHVMEGRDFTGELVSVNSKGFNVKIDGKVRTTALRNVEDIELVTDDEDEMTDEDIYAELGDGMTTAELAAHLSDALKTDLTPKELRVHLRALGLGVGKGRKYSLTATEYRLVRDLINTPAA